MSRAQVIEKLGPPSGSSTEGVKERLLYAQLMDFFNGMTDFEVILERDRVVAYGPIAKATLDDENDVVSSRPRSSPASGSGLTCQRVREFTTGFTKQCTYDCLGNMVIQTISHVELCPLMIERHVP